VTEPPDPEEGIAMTATANVEAITDDTRKEIVELREGGMTLGELRKRFPQLTSEQIRDVLPPANAREAKARAKVQPADPPKAKVEKLKVATDELTAPQVAKQIGADPKAFRRMLRKSGRGIGQGNRYSFAKSEVAKLRKEFAAYERAETERKAKAAAAKAEKTD
jgi:hypothetical protein